MRERRPFAGLGQQTRYFAAASLDRTAAASFPGGQVASKLSSAPAQPSLDNLVICGTIRPSEATAVSVISIWGWPTSESNRDRINRMPHCSKLDALPTSDGPLK